MPLAGIGHVQLRVINGASTQLGEAQAVDKVASPIEVAHASHPLDNVVQALSRFLDPLIGGLRLVVKQ